MFKTYYLLTKPGIIRGNALTAAAGYFLAAGANIDVVVFGAMLGGLSLVIASACVFNNYIDRGIDKKMARTSKRALASGKVSGGSALIFGSVLGLLGMLLLGYLTSLLTLGVAVTGFFFYVVVYGIYKRRSVHGTLIGSISGAIPPVVGYTSASNQLDMAALLLFLILVCWQMPHFYAIAMYRAKDYAAANIPVLPVAAGLKITRWQILLYIAAFTFACLMLSAFGYLSYGYGVVMLVLGISWFARALRGYKAPDVAQWGRGMFLYSIVVISVWCLAVSLDAILV